MFSAVTALNMEEPGDCVFRLNQSVSVQPRGPGRTRGGVGLSRALRSR